MQTRTISFRWLAATVSVLGAACFSVQADSSASGDIALDSLSVTPSSGTISWSGWNLDALSTTLNSDGAFSQNYDFNESLFAGASAGVPYASASTFAEAPAVGTDGIYGYATGNIVLPDINESANVSGGYGNFASFEAFFTLSQATTVSLSTGIVSSQASATDSGGQVLENEVIFALDVDSPPSPTLSYDNKLPYLGPNSSAFEGGLQTLTGSLTLAAGPHDLYIELDDEQQVVETTAPDYANTFLLLLAAVGSLAAARVMGGRSSWAEQRI
jgi:hypothetical protein